MFSKLEEGSIEITQSHVQKKIMMIKNLTDTLLSVGLYKKIQYTCNLVSKGR